MSSSVYNSSVVRKFLLSLDSNKVIPLVKSDLVYANLQVTPNWTRLHSGYLLLVYCAYTH